ncbi:MAG: hypothetical protein ABUJ98_14760 [Hyphomicrobium sp.]
MSDIDLTAKPGSALDTINRIREERDRLRKERDELRFKAQQVVDTWGGRKLPFAHDDIEMEIKFLAEALANTEKETE